MVVFMAGFPFAGKTYVLGKAVTELTDLSIIIISPKDYRPKGYEKLTETQQREINLASWKCSLETLEGTIKSSPIEEVIIYDTSCASLEAMSEYFEMAKKFKHKVFYVYVNAAKEIRMKRATANLPDEVMEKYKMNFKKSVPGLSKLADHAVVINNEVGLDLSKLIRLIRLEYDRIHQSE
jgi:predicted kinase